MYVVCIHLFVLCVAICSAEMQLRRGDVFLLALAQLCVRSQGKARNVHTCVHGVVSYLVTLPYFTSFFALLLSEGHI